MDLNDLYNTDKLYTLLFSSERKRKSGSIYFDSNFLFRYTTNHFFLSSFYQGEVNEYHIECAKLNLVDSAYWTYDKDIVEKLSYMKSKKEIELSHMVCAYESLNLVPKVKKEVYKAKDDDKVSDLALLMYQSYYSFGNDFSSSYVERILEVLEKDKLDYYALYDEGECVGYVSAFLNGDILKLEDFYIVPKCRNKGMATALIKEVISRYSFKYAYIISNIKNEAKMIYEHWGFNEVFRSYLIIK